MGLGFLGQVADTVYPFAKNTVLDAVAGGVWGVHQAIDTLVLGPMRITYCGLKYPTSHSIAFVGLCALGAYKGVQMTRGSRGRVGGRRVPREKEVKFMGLKFGYSPKEAYRRWGGVTLVALSTLAMLGSIRAKGLAPSDLPAMCR